MKLKHILPIGFSLALVSCGAYTNTQFSEYRGASVTQGTGGTVKQVNGLDVWTSGTPNRKFKILGLIDQAHTNDNSVLSVVSGMGKNSEIIKLAKAKGGDAIIYLSNSTKVTGYSTDGMAFGNSYAGYGSNHTHVHAFANTRANTRSQSRIAVIKYMD